jgi:hypothetical protein
MKTKCLASSWWGEDLHEQSPKRDRFGSGRGGSSPLEGLCKCPAGEGMSLNCVQPWGHEGDVMSLEVTRCFEIKELMYS